MKWKRFLAIVLAGALLFSMGACKKNETDDSSSAPSEPEEVVDPNYPVSIGDIHVDARPETIVSLSPAMTELICALGAGDRLEGVSDYCDYPSSVDDLERCGTAATPDLTAIEEIGPDVVFASSNLSQDDTVKLQQMDAQVIVLGRADSLDELEEVYVTAATVLDGLVDGEENGQAFFDGLRARYDALKYAADGIADRLHGIYLRMVPLTMATGDTFEGKLLNDALGVNNDAGQYTGWLYPEDQAVNLYPDIIFHDQSIDQTYFGETKVYSTTAAYQNKRLYAFDALAFERQSPRMFDELEEMFAQAYPEVKVQEAKSRPDDEVPEDADSEVDDDDEMLDLDDATQIIE